LSQAAAYLADTRLGCAAYRTLLANRTRALADAAPDALPDGQTHTTATSEHFAYMLKALKDARRSHTYVKKMEKMRSE
jgi:hypothetical protein